MSTLSLAQMQSLAASVGFPDPNLAAAIAEAESGGNTNAHGDTTLGSGAGSWGLWQIYVDSHPGVDVARLVDPNYNARIAYSTWLNAGKSFRPWSTYNQGLYLRWYMPPAPPPSSFPLSHVALIGAGLASAALLGWLAWKEYRQPGYLLPRTA